MRPVRGGRPALPRAVLVDTGGFCALTDVHDANHVAANDVIEALAAAHARLFTTDFIVAESHALILARLRRIDLALTFVNTIYESERMTIVPVAEPDKQSALLRVLPLPLTGAMAHTYRAAPFGSGRCWVRRTAA